MTTLPQSFSEFTSLSCNREQFIVEYLESHGIRTSIIALGNSRHVYAHFPSTAYNPVFKIKTALAHYDRVPASPGSNDNSAAVWQLMDWAVRLREFSGVHNVRIIFTDGEELGSASALTDMGSFGIAQRLKALGITNDDVYVFDCCGRGDVIVLAKTGGVGSTQARFKKSLDDLYKRTETLLRDTAGGSWFTLPVSYSDNAGFIAQGIPAVLITVLPSDEATRYARELHRDKKLEDLVLQNAGANNPLIKEKLPETWRLIHTNFDNDLSLTPKTFSLIAKLLDRIAETKTMA